MSVLAVIPARKGSKRIPDKNLQRIGRQTLVDKAIASTIGTAIASTLVSTDYNALWLRTTFDHDVSTVRRPDHLCTDTADIADAVKHATEWAEERWAARYDYIVTLQPAVLARSARIVDALLRHVIDNDHAGGLTMAPTVPWTWIPDGDDGFNGWSPKRYPRSQDSAQHLAEVNAVQICRRDCLGYRWGAPLSVAVLPRWAQALDIDTPEDLEEARSMWPWAKERLDAWEPPMLTFRTVNDIEGLRQQ